LPLLLPTLALAILPVLALAVPRLAAMPLPLLRPRAARLAQFGRHRRAVEDGTSHRLRRGLSPLRLALLAVLRPALALRPLLPFRPLSVAGAAAVMMLRPDLRHPERRRRAVHPFLERHRLQQAEAQP